MTTSTTTFDIEGPLPTGTTVLEASAGTGKTWTVAALVTRYVAEGHARLDELLVVTFGRAASQELRDRVREQLREAERALVDPASARAASGLVGLLVRGLDDAAVALRHQRLVQALADFDGATIATTHEFCQLVLRSLGVAGDTDAHVRLVEDLDDLVVEVVDDLYLARFGGAHDEPPFGREVALTLGRRAVEVFRARLEPSGADPAGVPGQRWAFARDVVAEVERRKRRRGVLSFDDLLGRLADALEREDSPARQRMRNRWRVVLVDEFQDTDPVQWQVLDRAFTGHATLVLIGDPKQAIYAFRGGDVFSYLSASSEAGERSTLGTNWRSDKPLVDALQVLTGGAALGDEAITVLPVAASPGHARPRLVGAPHGDPVRLRHVRIDDRDSPAIADVRARIAADLAADVAGLLAAAPTYADGPDGGARPLRPSDVAVLVQSLTHTEAIRRELTRRGIASVVTGGSSVLLSPGADEWLCLLEAMEQPQRTARVRAVALTSLVGESAAALVRDGDAGTDRVAELVRTWLDLFRARGIAAVFEAVTADGLGARVLVTEHGERLMTDLTHVAQLLHEAARRDRLGLPALLAWFRDERRSAARLEERSRRLDTDASAVQIGTIHGSKGLQYPLVYLPYAFNRWTGRVEETFVYHDDQRRRVLDVGGGPAGDQGRLRAAREDAGEELRLTYVALTRAQSQVVAWWAGTKDSVHSGLSRLLLRGPGEEVEPERLPFEPGDADAATAFRRWEREGGLVLEEAVALDAVAVTEAPAPQLLGVRAFDRGLDLAWRRTSYSGLIRAEEQAGPVEAEPEVPGTVDEDLPAGDDVPEAVTAATEVDASLLSPMEALPAGATFGSLVHEVLEHADPEAPDLLAELRAKVTDAQRWWSVDATTEALAEALVPMQHTSLGPLAADRTLAQVPLRDRLRELDFEFPLVGGDHPASGLPTVPLSGFADVLENHLRPDDPMRAYAARLRAPALGDQVLRGYLSGSIDVVLRVGGRFVVVDYKTNRLGVADRPLTALDYTQPLMTEAMLHSHYPLQALLYSVVLHRYLRWRLPGYDPEQHLGGVLYLYVRGMVGARTPVVDGQPCGVFAWRPPAAAVVALSDLLAGVVSAQ